MKKLKLLAALLALTVGLAGCGAGTASTPGSTPSSKPEKMLDGDKMTAPPTQTQEYTEPEDVTYMRLLAGEDEYRACVLYLGGSYKMTTDVQQVLDSQQGLRELWGFVYDIPEDHWVISPEGGCDLYCIFPQDPDSTLFVYEATLTDDAENPLQRSKQLYYSEDGQPILLLCNISDIVPNTEVELYPSADEELVFSPFLSGENVDVSITGNSTNPTRFQHPVAGTYKKERLEAGKKYFSVASGGGTGRTLHPDNMAAGPASYGFTDTLGRMHSDAQFAGSSSVPAHVEMMGLIGMGNNPMVGATVAVAVSIEEAAKAGKF